jgi:hypothetical protein
MAVYRFKKGVTALLDRREGDRSASRLLRLDLADLTAIRDIQVERKPALQLDVNGRPVGEPLRTFSGKPIFTDQSRELITLDVTFFIRTGQVSLFSQELGANVDNMSISLVKVINEEAVLPIAVSMINIGNLRNLLAIAERSPLPSDRADVANIQNDVSGRGETDDDLLFPIRTSLNFSLEDAVKAAGNDMEDLNLNLALIFGLFKSHVGVPDLGVPVEKSAFRVDYDLEKDLKVYHTVKNPVKISAFASSLDQSLITIEKPRFCNAEKVRVLRRILRPGRPPGPFESVKEIDFPSDTDTKTSESYTEVFIDGNPNFDQNSVVGPVDNTVRYQYRAVPVGKDDAGTIVFKDSYTDPITQANFEIGSDLQVLPELKSIKGVLRQIGFSVHDSGLLDPGPLLVDATSDIALVSYYNADGAITVEISNLEQIAAIDILRRDISRNEVHFSPVKDVDELNKSKHLTAEMRSDARILYTDTSVIEGHLYEYAVRSYTNRGLAQISDDKTRIQFRDKRLLPADITVSASDPELEGTTAVMEFDITIPQNITSLVNALLGTRDPNSRQTPFFQDIIDNRKNLPPLLLPVVRRLDLTTGEERKFSSLTLDAPKFEDLTPPSSGPGLPNVFNFRFTDDELNQGSKYRYEVLINSRLPLSLLPSKIFVKDNIRRPYIFQPAKIQNPIFLQRGILPPTREGQDFLSAEDINPGPDRILNRLTQEDPFEVGSTAARQVVPATSTIDVESEPGFALADPIVSKTRQSALQVYWTVSGDVGNLDHFQVIATDTYIAPPLTSDDVTGASCRRSQTVALIPAQGAGPNYTVEAKLERLMESDYNDFVPVVGDVVPPMSVLQELVDERRVTVTRTFQVIASYHDGTRNRVVIKSTEPSSIISPLTSFASDFSKINLPPKYALSPNVALATSIEAEKVQFEEIMAEMNQANNANNGGGGGNMGLVQADEHGNGVIVNNTVIAGNGNAPGAVAISDLGGNNKTAQKDKNAKKKKGKAGNKNSGWLF